MTGKMNGIIIKNIGSKLNERINNVISVSGGSINHCYCLQTEKRKCFVKLNDDSSYPGMFAAEAAGLKLIASTNTIHVPEIIVTGQADGESYLLLEWIETKPADAQTSALTGTNLAEMHRYTADSFGLVHNNYMGSLPQSNKQHDSWSAFFIAERLQPMVKIALEQKLLTENDAAGFEKLYLLMPGLFNEEAPALIHGDLWSGNCIISADALPYLIDPAVSYGNREFDIAMTTIFGGFSMNFYAAYHKAFPLNKGWEDRLALWNLYPLLLHLNLFGTGYLSKVRTNLMQYIKG